ncbi:hypothetical protein [Microcystis aeruginosa]|nr:hypothetical protein [Microcystis aeruginosa]
MGKWGSGEVGKWGSGEVGKLSHHPITRSAELTAEAQNPITLSPPVS